MSGGRKKRAYCATLTSSNISYQSVKCFVINSDLNVIQVVFISKMLSYLKKLKKVLCTKEQFANFIFEIAIQKRIVKRYGQKNDHNSIPS